MLFGVCATGTSVRKRPDIQRRKRVIDIQYSLMILLLGGVVGVLPVHP